MTRVCMVTLTDVRNDLRIRKEAATLAKRYDVVVISHIVKPPSRAFELDGFRVVAVPLWTRRLPKWPVFWLVKYKEFVLRAVRAALRERAAVRHGHDLSGAMPAMIAARLRGSAFVYDAHELEADQESVVHRVWWLRRILLACLRIVMRRADRVICASEARARIMLAEYGARELPTAILNVTPRAGLPQGGTVNEFTRGLDLSGKRVALYQGSIAPGRGLDRVARALRMLPDDVVLLIVGGGSTSVRDELIAITEREGTRSRLHMTGHVPADSLTAYMALAHVGIAIYRNTCRNNYHCAPNKLFEYASQGLPVVGPNFPEVESVIDGHGIGATFDPESPESIAAALRDVLDNPARREEMSRRAVKLKDTVNWEAQEERLLALYDGLLARRVP